MSHQMTALLYGAAALAGLYWWMKMRRVLPMECKALKAQAATQSLSDFARELLGSHRLPSDPQLLKDILRQSSERFSAWEPGIAVAVWKKDAITAELVYSNGPLASLDSQIIQLPPDLWSDVFSGPRGSLMLMPSGDSRPRTALPRATNPDALSAFFQGLNQHGFHSVRLLSWGRSESLHGILMACDPAENGEGLERAGQRLEIMAGHFTAVADMAASFWEINEKRHRLEGGLSALHEVATTITSHQDRPVDMLSAIVSIVAKALEADMCAFLLYDERTGELVTQAGAYGLSGDEGALYRLPVTNEKSSSVRVFLTGSPFMTGDAQNDPRVIAHYAKLWRSNSVVVVPLTLEDRRIGVMRVGSFKKNFFTQDHMQLLQLVAEEAVVLIESALLTKKLTEANQKLSEINQLKDEFVSTASHEFKTPLTSVKGFISVLLDGDAGPLTEEQRRFLVIARSAADRLTALVTDLLDLSRLEAGILMEFGPVSLSKLSEECRHDYETQARDKSIQLRLSMPAHLPMVRGDGKWLRQALDNLVTNALKFTPSGGVVTISAGDRGDVVQVSVADTGVGISPEDQKRIFEKFYRAHNRELTNPPGTGLGLAIVKFIMDKHEGRIWVESEMGRGSNFHFILPVVKGMGDAGASSKEDVPTKHMV